MEHREDAWQMWISARLKTCRSSEQAYQDLTVSISFVALRRRRYITIVVSILYTRLYTPINTHFYGVKNVS